ncbi:putative holin-like toxin [Listeria rocourtiae]|uniref:putative holin-like toxin n=1 Tax=Listeria rocourtiae TaxID=647910 RepID=UPI003D2F7A8D
MSVAEALQLAVGFGSLLISLIALVIALIKLNNDQKNNHQSLGRDLMVKLYNQPPSFNGTTGRKSC